MSIVEIGLSVKPAQYSKVQKESVSSISENNCLVTVIVG